jgi:hypothetical protein
MKALEMQHRVNSVFGMVHTGHNSTNFSFNAERPIRKSSFSSKFSNANSKAGAYIVENTKIIDRTANAAFNFLGWDFEIKLHQYKDLLVASHITAGLYDFIHGDKSPYSSLGSVVYTLNEKSDFFTYIENVPLKCTVEGGYALLRGYPDIPLLFTPSSGLVGALINFSLCFNRETNSGTSKDLIDSTLKFTKAMLQAQNSVFHAIAKMENPYPILEDIYQTGNFLGELKELWENNDPALASRTLAYTKASWNLYDIHSYFNTAPEDNHANTCSHADEKGYVGEIENVNDA